MQPTALTVTIEAAKTSFFDRLAIEGRVRKARIRLLSREGAFVRTRAISLMLGHKARRGFGAKSSVSNREGSSAAGQPPFPHTGDLVRWVLFAYDDGTDTVVVGPAKLNKPGTAPAVLEHGGDELIEITRHGRREQATAHYEPHPYMQPALEAEAPKFAGLWANSIK